MILWIVYGKPNRNSPTYILGAFEDYEAAFQAEADAQQGGWHSTDVADVTLTREA